MQWASRKLTIREDIASLTDASVYLQYGQTTVLAAVVMDETPKTYVDFIPLSVHYIEKAYAANRIPGGYIKREGKPQDHEVIISRLIDRGLRPLIADGLQNEVQVIIHVLSYDPEVGSIIPSFLAASIAMQRSPVPFKGPIAACHVGLLNGRVIINPTINELKMTDADLIVAGNETKLLMIEGGASEISNTDLLKLTRTAIQSYQPVIQFIKTFKQKPSDKKPIIIKENTEIKRFILKSKKQFHSTVFHPLKKERRIALKKIKTKLIEKYPGIDTVIISKSLQSASQDILFEYLIKTKKRMDGRGFEEIRPIKIETHHLPHLHGSALFTRGETQVLGILTLGRFDEKQNVDELSGYKAYYFLSHYNFPQFCVGDIDKMGGSSRREIGHGHIVYRALSPLLPEPLYTYRLISEVFASNGSSSMASVCAGSLCFMDAGIPIKRHVAGIALGLVQYQNQFEILIDILGDEDHLGLMDLKICATEKGITALQMDVAITKGISLTLLNKAIQIGRAAISSILEQMKKQKPNPSKHLPNDVKRVCSLRIDRQQGKQLLTRKDEGGIKTIERITNTRIDLVDSRFLINADNFNNIFRAKKLIYESLGFFEKDHVYDAILKDTENLMLETKEQCEGYLSTRKKIKLKAGSPIQVKFLEINIKGELIFEMMT